MRALSDFDEIPRLHEYKELLLKTIDPNKKDDLGKVIKNYNFQREKLLQQLQDTISELNQLNINIIQNVEEIEQKDYSPKKIELDGTVYQILREKDIPHNFMVLLTFSDDEDYNLLYLPQDKQCLEYDLCDESDQTQSVSKYQIDLQRFVQEKYLSGNHWYWGKLNDKFHPMTSRTTVSNPNLDHCRKIVEIVNGDETIEPTYTYEQDIQTIHMDLYDEEISTDRTLPIKIYYIEITI